MALTTSKTSFKSIMNQVLPGILANMLVAIGFGDMLRALPTYLRRKKPATNSYNLATVKVLTMPDDAKALYILDAYARVGTTTGALTAVAAGTTPSSGQIAVTPNGDIATLGTDAITDMDVTYVPAKMDIIEMILPVVSSSLALPTSVATPGAVMLLEAESLVGTLVGKMIVLAPNASNPATTKANLDVAKANVLFATADAVTSARVKLGVCSAIDVDAIMEATSVFI